LSIVSSAPSSVPSSHLALAALIWPQRNERIAGALRAAVLVVAGTALLTLSAKANLPLPYVPMTLQTLVVLMIGAAYGSRLGAATMIAYLAEGALGLPVFAGPIGGLAPLLGPTAGYLFGFVVAAYLTGWLSERGWDASVPRLFVAMGIGHLVILGLGWSWLAFGLHLGMDKAWLVGIAPFIAATLIKNALGAVLLPSTRRLLDRRRG
jgi:biotin transport system substrate-specific component